MMSRLVDIISIISSQKKICENLWVIILGPTSSGKTSFAIELAKQLDGEIISADSRQIYRHMDIATAKPSKSELEAVPHHMIDIVDPDESFTVVDFQERAKEAILEIQSRGKIPFIVGGTGLYIDALVYGFDVPGVQSDPKYRDECLKIIEEQGIAVLHERLRKLDPQGAEKVHPNNIHHLIRALEVVEKTGKSKFELGSRQKCPSNVLMLGLQMDREELYERINKRVDMMFANGVEEEAKSLLSMGYSVDLPSMTSIGYLDIAEMLEGKKSREEVVAAMQKKTRNYAKRQMTWFRRNNDIRWIVV